MPENSNRCRDFTTREAAYDLCEDLDGEFVKGIQAAAAELSIMVAIGVDVKDVKPPDARIAQLLIGADGKMLHVHHNTVFWDYEYTLFVRGTKELEVIPTPIGKIGLFMCVDGIVPEVSRIAAVKGAEILCNS
jgi:predicted amidohydrolase